MKCLLLCQSIDTEVVWVGWWMCIVKFVRISYFIKSLNFGFFWSFLWFLFSLFFFLSSLLLLISFPAFHNPILQNIHKLLMLFLPFFNPFSDRFGLLFTLSLYILGVDLLGSLFHTFSSFLFVFFIKFHHIFVQIFFPLDYCQMVLREYVLYIIRILLFTYIAKTFILLAAASNSGIGWG